MSLSLNTIKNTKKKKQRVGRGNASGRGTYCTRGLKGQRARSGGKSGLKLKGFKRNLLNLPKYKGTKSIRPNNQIVKLSDLEKSFDNEKVTPGTLFEAGFIASMDLPVKILYDIDVKKKFEVFGCLLSKTARVAIEKAGGSVIDIAERGTRNADRGTQNAEQQTEKENAEIAERESQNAKF